MSTVSFKSLGLAPEVLSALQQLGYEHPTPIQAESIPVLMSGQDLLAQAQTGTGKTAAFALPALSTLDLSVNAPQILVIAPTRELAIQVSEAFQRYARELPDFHVIPIYGGQDYRGQLKALKRGVHVVVGTPGRTMDHLRRGTLSTDALKMLVLDEADEMLKMGFIDDVEWIMSQIPHQHQTALFSATLLPSIKKIAKRYQTDAHHIHIETKEQSVETIEQCYTIVRRDQKLDLLTRFLEIENFEAAIVFARTKTSTTELAEKLQARGYTAAALNGDMVQAVRQKTIEQIKTGALDIVVATDVAARGIDVERITHVINFDISHDVESYIHRIGRTGRAGRQGKALLFVTPREQRLLRDIERTIGKQIDRVEPPSNKALHIKRGEKLSEQVEQVLSQPKKLKPYYKMLDHIIGQNHCDTEAVAAALAYLLQKPSADEQAAPQAVSCEFDSPRSRSRNKSKFTPKSRPGRSDKFKPKAKFKQKQFNRSKRHGKES